MGGGIGMEGGEITDLQSDLIEYEGDSSVMNLMEEHLGKVVGEQRLLKKERSSCCWPGLL